MIKALGFAFVGLCVVATLFDVAWRVFGALTTSGAALGSGAFAIVLLASPFFMKPSDVDINDAGIVHAEEDEEAPGADLRGVRPDRLSA
jgi:hypothetical protein